MNNTDGLNTPTKKGNNPPPKTPMTKTPAKGKIQKNDAKTFIESKQFTRIICIVITICFVISMIFSVIVALLYAYMKKGGMMSESFDFGENVEQLTSKNFDDFVGYGGSSFVMFYAPWCGHCKRAKPEFNSLGDVLKEKEDVRIGAVNCDNQKSLCQKIGVRGFPTFLFFNSRNIEKGGSKFSGSRTVEEFSSFIARKSGPVVIPLLSKEEIDQYEVSHSGMSFIIGTFPRKQEEETNSFYEDFKAIAENFNEQMTFFALFVDADDGEEKSSHLGYEILPFFDREDVRKLDLTEDKESLEELFVFYSFPLIETFDRTRLDYLREENKPILVLFQRKTFDASEDDEEKESMMNDMLNANFESILGEFAIEMKRKDMIPAIGYYRDHYKQLVSMFGKDRIEFPLLACLDLQNKKRYLYEEVDVSVDLLKTWMNHIINHELPSFKKSEALPLPEEQEERLVKKVVGDSLKMMIGITKGEEDFETKQRQDVFISLCKGMTTPCHRYYEVYRVLVNYLKPFLLSSKEQFVLGHMDLTNNEIPEDIEGAIPSSVPLGLFWNKERKTPFNPSLFSAKGNEEKQFFDLLQFVWEHVQESKEQLREFLMNESIDLEKISVDAANELDHVPYLQDIFNEKMKTKLLNQLLSPHSYFQDDLFDYLSKEIVEETEEISEMKEEEPEHEEGEEL